MQEWTAEEAAQYLAYGITVAEGDADSVPARDFRAARDRMLRDPVARRLAPAFVTRCSTPNLLWGYLRSKATGRGSWNIRRGVMHEAVDPILDALAGASPSPRGSAANPIDGQVARRAAATALSAPRRRQEHGRYGAQAAFVQTSAQLGSRGTQHAGLGHAPARPP